MNLQQLKSKIEEAKADKKNTSVCVGSGLYAQIKTTAKSKSGSPIDVDFTSWVFRYRFAGKPKSVGGGAFPKVGMSEAIKWAKDKATQVRHDRDPSALKSERAATAAAAAAHSVTFKEATRQFVATGALKGFRNAKHRQQWETTLASTDTTLGRLAVSKIEPADVAAVLLPIWNDNRPTALRLAGRIRTVCDFAKVKKFRTGENPARLELLKMLLPADKAPQVVHHAAMPWKAVPVFMGKLRAVEGPVARALELVVLCASRRGEIEGLRWDEIDLDAATMTIPEHRMKMGKTHIVPLSNRAVEILRTLPRTGELVFEGNVKDRPFGNARLNLLLADMGEDDVTVHGFRSAFRDWAEETGEHFGAAEAALAHIKGGVVGAYLRTTHMARRKILMQRWADYCEHGTADNVSALREVA